MRLKTLIFVVALSLPLLAQTGLSGAHSKLSGANSGMCLPSNPVLQSITVSPGPTSTGQGSSVGFTALGTFSSGAPRDITLSVVWTSSNTSNVTLGPSANPQNATCTVSASGTTVITATDNATGISGTSTLTCFAAPFITTASLPTGTVGTAYTATLSATGGTLPYSWSITSGTLPLGLTLNNTSPNGTITGTPSSAGTSLITIQVQDAAAHTGSVSLPLVISGASSGLAALPQLWANELESCSNPTSSLNLACTSVTPYTNVVNYPSVGTGGGWTCHGTNYGPYTAGVISGAGSLSQAVQDLETCRTNFNESGVVLTSTVFNSGACSSSGGNCLFFPQTAGDTSTQPIVIDSITPMALGTNHPLGSTFALQARVGTYAISSSSGLVRASNVVTVTTTVAMVNAPHVGELVTIWLTDDRSFGGQYPVCGPPTTGCITPTTTHFTYQQTGANATTQNGVVWALEAQNTPTSLVSSGCAATNDQCIITATFASALPACGTFGGYCPGDRIRIQNASPPQFNGTFYVCGTDNTNTPSCPAITSTTISLFSYTEFFGNATATSPGVILGGNSPQFTNHIFADQVNSGAWGITLTNGSGPLVIFAPQAHNFAMYDYHFQVASGITPETFILADMESTSQNNKSGGLSNANCNGLPAQANCIEPIHVGMDRGLVNGWSYPYVGATQSQIRGAVKMQCGWCYFTNSATVDINDINSDAEDLGGKDGTGPFKIVENYIEGGTENMMTGSYQGCNIVAGNVTPANWEIRMNYVTKNQFQTMNASVKRANASGAKYFNYILKNSDEVKDTQQTLRTGNVFEMSSGGSGQQNGALQANNSTDDNGNATSYQACNAGQGTYDINDISNIYRHGGGWAYIPTRGGVTLPTVRINEQNNLIYDLGNAPAYQRQGWDGTKWGAVTFQWGYEIAARNRSFPQSLGTGKITNVQVASNVATISSTNVFYAGAVVTITGLTHTALNGTWTISAIASGTFSFNVTTANIASTADSGTATGSDPYCTATSTTSGGITTATVTCAPPSDHLAMPGMGIYQNDWVTVFNCADSHYNVVAPQEVPNLNAGGFNSYSISYIPPNASGISASTTGCIVANALGYPQYFNLVHNTLVADFGQTNAFYNNVAFNTNRLFVMPNTGNPAANTLSRNVTNQGNIFSITGLTPVTKGSTGNNASLFYYAGLGTSNSQTECYFFDCNTLVLNYNLFTNGVTASNYTEYNCPLGVCGANNGASPPVTDIFLGSGTPGDSCSNPASPDQTCIGFTGNRATSIPPDFAPRSQDYHVFDLLPGSYWATGNPGAMPDTTSRGVDLNALDAAQVTPLYVCNSACGSGPFP